MPYCRAEWALIAGPAGAHRRFPAIPTTDRVPRVISDDRDSHAAPPSVPSSEGGSAPAPARARIEPPPRHVLDRARRRDPEALEAFFDRYFEPVHALAYRLVGERAVAEDLAQEVFLKVHRALDTLDPGRDPWPWLATIVHNACRDLWRSGAYRMGRRSDSLEDDTARAERIPAPAASPESALLASERERLVREAIGRLPESLRETVLLYDYQGLNHLEVARMLGIEHAAARKRYSRALDALGKLLHESMER